MSATNILEGLKMTGKPAEIPDCSRDDLPEFFKLMGYKVGAEIGVFKGEFTETLGKSGLKIYGIDPWRAYTGYNEFQNEGMGRFQAVQDKLYEESRNRVAPYENVTLIKKTSMEAIEDFEDNSLDFVYIDGHHGFRYVAEDLCEWFKKVKVGGVISGHDYALNKKSPLDPYCLHVKYVLHAFVDAYRISDFYVLGRRYPEGERRIVKAENGAYHGVYAFGERGEIRDQWRSWFFVKGEI